MMLHKRAMLSGELYFLENCLTNTLYYYSFAWKFENAADDLIGPRQSFYYYYYVLGCVGNNNF